MLCLLITKLLLIIPEIWSTWSFYFVKCKISHFGKFLNNFFLDICLLRLLFMFKASIGCYVGQKNLLSQSILYVCCLHRSHWLPWEGLGRWVSEALLLAHLSQKRSKNLEVDVSLNTCDPQKHRNQNYVKNQENLQFPLFFVNGRFWILTLKRAFPGDRQRFLKSPVGFAAFCVTATVSNTLVSSQQIFHACRKYRGSHTKPEITTGSQ